MEKAKNKVYNVDFRFLENSNYKSLSKFGKEIIDKMIAMQEGATAELTPIQEAKLELIYSAMKDLTSRQKEVMERLFGIGEFKDEGPSTEKKVAEALGIAQQSVHELKVKAIKNIQKSISVNENAIRSVGKRKK